jgi:subtilisin-like proprotein convertase family protein
MQPNFTLKKFGFLLRPLPVLFVFCCLFAGNISAQQYSNGPLSTGTPNSVGVAAPAGFTWSEMQPGTNTLGFGANVATGFSVADDFTIGCGSWTVNKITVYAYSTGFAGPASPFNDVRIAIYSANPNTNPAPIFGDRTTNRFLASSTASMYRVAPGASVTNRNIYKVEATIPGIVLNPGTYWIEWSVGGATNFAPPVTVIGATGPAGANGQQRSNTGTWTALVDGTPQAMPFLIDYTSTPCSGTPAPGNTIASTGSACAGINFNLSLQNCTPGSGITYQWQQATAVGGPYTNIAGATSSTLTTSLTAATFYRANVTCGGNTGTSTPVQVLLNPPTACYCAAGSTSTAFEKISNVTYGTINNNSTSTAGYENFTAISTTMVHGQTAQMRVSISGGFATDQVAVWIDYNQDGDFLDGGELVLTTAAGAGPLTGNITISPSATVGSTRMRVRMFDSDFNTAAPCGNTAFGQVEDYTVNIQPCFQGVFTTQPSNASIQCSQNASFSITTTGSALDYQWQQRVTSAAPWTTVTNGGVFSGATTTTLTLTNVSTSLNGYQYRAVMVGPCTAIDFSNPATLTVNPLIATVNPTAASICLGSIQQLTLTNASSPATAVFNATAGLPLSIPDNNQTGVLSTATVSGLPVGALVTNISINFTMTHTWAGDVVMNLKAPNGQVLNLVAALDGGTGSNGTANFTNTTISSTGTTALSGAPAPRTGTFRADAFNAAIPTVAPTTTNTWAPLLTTLNGNWQLGICDIGPADLGVLTSWSISLTYGAQATGVWTSAAPATMFTDAAATVPYVAGSQASTIFVRPTTTTNYSVVYSTATPCTSTPTVIPVTVVNPITSGTVNSASACVGNNATFTVTAVGGTPSSYQWQVSTDGGTTYTNIAGATSATYTVSGATLAMNNNRYRAVLAATPCAGTINSAHGTLTVNALPAVTLTATDLLLAPGQTSTLSATSNPSGTSYTWTLNGSPAPQSTTASTYTANIDRQGTYVVTATTAFGCTSSAALAGTITIGAEPSDKLWIYPNPSTGQFQVRLYYAGGVTEKRKVSIFKSNGQLITEKEFYLDNISNPYLRMDFDLSRYAAGTYVVKVNNTITGSIVSGLVIIQ